MKKKKDIYAIFNKIEPLLIAAFGILAFITIITAFNNVDWVSLGGTRRPFNWYENLISVVALILPIIVLFMEIYIFSIVNNKYKGYTLIYLAVDIIISIAIAFVIPVIGLLISIFAFNTVKCIYRIKNKEKILKK